MVARDGHARRARATSSRAGRSSARRRSSSSTVTRVRVKVGAGRVKVEHDDAAAAATALGLAVARGDRARRQRGRRPDRLTRRGGLSFPGSAPRGRRTTSHPPELGPCVGRRDEEQQGEDRREPARGHQRQREHLEHREVRGAARHERAARPGALPFRMPLDQPVVDRDDEPDRRERHRVPTQRRGRGGSRRRAARPPASTSRCAGTSRACTARGPAPR